MQLEEILAQIAVHVVAGAATFFGPCVGLAFGIPLIVRRVLKELDR